MTYEFCSDPGIYKIFTNCHLSRVMLQLFQPLHIQISNVKLTYDLIFMFAYIELTVKTWAWIILFNGSINWRTNPECEISNNNHDVDAIASIWFAFTVMLMNWNITFASNMIFFWIRLRISHILETNLWFIIISSQRLIFSVHFCCGLFSRFCCHICHDSFGVLVFFMGPEFVR